MNRFEDGRTTLQASMGPRLVSRGKVSKITAHDRLIGASMGPRLVSRGKFALALLGKPPLHASMGPRLVSRGKMPSCVS